MGRRQGQIQLPLDSNVSSVHGRVISLPNGQLLLQDAGSQNQFLVNGHKVETVGISEGTRFQVGQSLFEVLRIKESELSQYSVERSWKDAVFAVLKKNSLLGTSSAAPLSPTVQVECLQGPSAETTWLLGFGPRIFGPLSEDISFLEKDSPDQAFEISQGPLGPLIRPLAKKVLINGQSLDEKLLDDGDEIRVGTSLFKVRLG